MLTQNTQELKQARKTLIFIFETAFKDQAMRRMSIFQYSQLYGLATNYALPGIHTGMAHFSIMWHCIFGIAHLQLNWS